MISDSSRMLIEGCVVALTGTDLYDVFDKVYPRIAELQDNSELRATVRRSLVMGSWIEIDNLGGLT